MRRDSSFCAKSVRYNICMNSAPQNYQTQQNKQRIVRSSSWQLLSVDWPLEVS